MSIFQSLARGNLLQSLRGTAATVVGALCTVGGLVADVLQPIAPFASYLALIAVVGFAACFYLYRRGREEFLGGAAFSAIAAGIFGLIVLFQSGEAAEESGFIAAAVPAVGDLQASLGIIDAKLDAIAEDTSAIAESTARLEESSAEVLRTLEEMQASFASAGSIIANPSSPEEHYRNARLHELAGNYSAARRSYLAYFQSDLQLLDPHLRFVAFLKVQEGTAGARETYNTLMEARDSGVVTYVRRLLLPVEQRVVALTDYAAENPDYAPVHYHLSLEVSERRLGAQTLSQKRQEREYLRAFVAADEAGGLLRHLIDQELAQQWRNDAATRLQALAASEKLLDNPVSISWMPNNSGYTGTVTIAEPASEILWKMRGGGSPVSTGESGYVDPRTGQPQPRSFFNLPKNQRDGTVEISYRDGGGELHGPFAFPFKARQESQDANRRILEATTTSWLSFRDYDGKRLLYFSHLMAYRGSIKSIKYGLNSTVPTKNFRFPAWRKGGLAPIDERTPLYKSVPRSTRFATVQLTYKDGSKSAVHRFDYVRQR